MQPSAANFQSRNDSHWLGIIIGLIRSCSMSRKHLSSTHTSHPKYQSVQIGTRN
ncbi:hypothetical protein M758_1G169900 [Ceratodon purpureus]|uniref:Uncharacterized protein n=1 Tax=Ceratodon purpureus TaxID=3225 RepID=A0A8T0J788_CERPU|nr:hypothetical protein KC19_1G173300 [Ceratodon purpureus]KAG0630320.1 hypothetical protein M758_1G169900 [Ceratodon purpureus]